MSVNGAEVGESTGAGPGSAGRAGGFVAVAGVVAIVAGKATIGSLPDAGIGAPGIYEFFLDHGDEITRPAALTAIGLLGVLVLFATLRSLARDGRRGAGVAGAVMLALAQVGIGLQIVALALLCVLGLRPADADPGTSRAILDLSELLAGISGAALAAALAAAAITLRRRPGLLPARFAGAALLAAAGVALWTVRLFSDAGAFAADSLLGSTLGWILLLAWVVAAGVWLLAIGAGRSAERRPASAGEQPDGRAAPAPDEQAALTRAERVAKKLPRSSSPRKPFVPPPYPESQASQPPASTDKPATPPDEPATVPPEPESGSAAEPAATDPEDDDEQPPAEPA